MLRLRSKALHYRKIVDLSFFACLISTIIFVSKPNVVLGMVCGILHILFSISTIYHYVPYLYYKMLYYDNLKKRGLLK